MSTPLTTPNDALAKRNVATLIAVQSTAGAIIPTHFILGALAGGYLAHSPVWATMPISMTIIGSMFAAPILSGQMARFGRPIVFFIATILGGIGLLINSLALYQESFALFLIGSALIGIYMAAQALFRFAATDLASASFRPRAISYTMTGGLMAAILGPSLAANASDLFAPIPFAGAYALGGAICIFAAIFFIFLKLPRPDRQSKRASTADLRATLARPQIIAAMLIATISYSMMNLMMTATPLAIIGCGFLQSDAADVVRLHILGMFVPSFFTGHLINYFGLRRIIFAGLAIMTMAALVALSGVALWQFDIALILLGIGWNFGFIGGTALLAQSVTEPGLQKRVQGVNDFVLWTSVAIASLSSGVLMNVVGDGAQGGWIIVALAMLPFIFIAGAVLMFLTRAPKTKPV